MSTRDTCLIQPMHVHVFMFSWEYRNKESRITVWTTVLSCCSHLQKKQTNAMLNDNIVQTDRRRYPWQHHLFGSGFEHLCCAKSTTLYANALGNRLSPNLAVHLIHLNNFNLRFDGLKCFSTSLCSHCPDGLFSDCIRCEVW